jgi:hypothetical protein
MKEKRKLQQLRTDWQNSLEMQLSENEEGLVEFNQLKSEQLKEIE